MLGMRKLSSSYLDDQRLGLKLLRFSNEAMQHLERKRNGGTQNITVSYSYHGQGECLDANSYPKPGDQSCQSKGLRHVGLSAEPKEANPVASQE